MSVFEKFELDEMPFQMMQEEFVCFECGEPIAGCVIAYDGYAREGFLKSIVFHPSCATVVGQRLISDGYPNRRK